MDKLISVIVPVFNTEKYLDRCINSIINQTYTSLEIIIIDDGSEAMCAEKCDEYSNIDKRIIVKHTENMGLSEARNLGITLAKGEYIGFVDSDDYVEPTMYEKLLSAALDNSLKISCCGRIEEYKDKTQKKFTKEKITVWSTVEALQKLFRWDGLDSAAWDKIYHKSLFIDISYPRGEISEDVPVTAKLIAKAGGIVHIGEALYHYCRREGSITTSEYNKYSFKVINHAAEISMWVKQNYPEAVGAAETFYVTELQLMLYYYQLSSFRTRKKYAKDAEKMYDLLKKSKTQIIDNNCTDKKMYYSLLVRRFVIVGMLKRMKDRLK